MTTLEQNKQAVIRFNKEVIENGNLEAFKSLVTPDFINRTAPEGAPNNSDSLWYFFNSMLRPAFPDLKVIIHQQIAEGDLVTSIKSITGTHTGELMGIAATQQKISIEVIDVIKLKDGKYDEHWGQNTFADVIAKLKAA